MTIKRDATKPAVAFSGNAGTYSVLDDVAIDCTATDALSGIASSTCPDANGPAWSFGAGSHTLSASAADKAGNQRTAATTFVVTVSPSSLCLLTGSFVQESSRYRALGPLARKVVDRLTSALCDGLAKVVPRLNDKQKAALLAAYKLGVVGLVHDGWLTQDQGIVLRDLADSL